MKPTRRMIQSCWGFFDEAWPQPFENSQRMWSFDRTVTIKKPFNMGKFAKMVGDLLSCPES